jgi:hypothetical protein
MNIKPGMGIDTRSYPMSDSIPHLDIDIIALIELFNTNPKAAEQLRTALIEYTIASAPEHLHQRLRGLQSHIDMKKRSAKTPIEHITTLSEMMFESLMKLHQNLHDLLDLTQGKSIGSSNKEPQKKATILPYTPRTIL